MEIKTCEIVDGVEKLEAAVKAGVPEGIISWIDVPSLEMTNLVMKKPDLIYPGFLRLQ